MKTPAQAAKYWFPANVAGPWPKLIMPAQTMQLTDMIKPIIVVTRAESRPRKEYTDMKKDTEIPMHPVTVVMSKKNLFRATQPKK